MRQQSLDQQTPRQRRDLRRVATELARYWDTIEDRVPAPVLRILVTLPWLLRRLPVPFWVPAGFLIARRIRARRRSKAVTVSDDDRVPKRNAIRPGSR
ncbi:MAG TPA: hypothetical protein VFX16_33510 [Pseudonocardiaceae bacterium]|nr:hypothetical protein [Pseudonocardiaceae bacterium]